MVTVSRAAGKDGDDGRGSPLSNRQPGSGRRTPPEAAGLASDLPGTHLRVSPTFLLTRRPASNRGGDEEASGLSLRVTTPRKDDELPLFAPPFPPRVVCRAFVLE